MKKIWSEFREFALRSNFLDITIGIFIGAGLTPVATSLVSDVVMPAIGYILGEADFTDFFFVLHEGNPVGPYSTLSIAKKAGAVTINYGLFVNTLISFFAIAWVAFGFVKLINRIKRNNETDKKTQESSTKVCHYCLYVVPVGASRCPHCTSDI